MITEFKIKCLTDRGLTKCYISKIIFYILPVTGSILNCYQKNTSSLPNKYVFIYFQEIKNYKQYTIL